MKILYICHRFPFPPKRGGKIRPFNMISHLSQNHEVTVISLARSNGEALDGEGIAEHCHEYKMARIGNISARVRMVANMVTMQPSSMGYFYSPEMEGYVKQALTGTDFDLIFVHCSSVAQYVENTTNIPKILDFGDMDSQKWLEYSRVRHFPMSLGYWLEGIKLERSEKILAGKFNYCTCTTKAELETLRSFNTGVRADWFPNGVDYEFFKPDDRPYEPDTVCFIGRMDYYPNQECMFDFCKNTLPLIRQKRPGVKLKIIGANPSPEIRDLDRLENVTVTGSVPDVRPHVLSSAVNIAPLNIARGTQNKILESLAMGVPVVSSIQAAGGIDALPDKHFLMASTPQEYAEAIIRLLESKEDREKFSQAGRERMLSNHDWHASMLRLDQIIEDCLKAAS